MDQSSSNKKVLVFGVEGQNFCVPINYIVEIRVWAGTTMVPNSPEFVLGLLNTRGQVLPVIDLALRLGFQATAPTSRHVIAIVIAGDKNIGLLVQSVSDIRELDFGQCEDEAVWGGNQIQECCSGLVVEGEKFFRVLDLGRLLPSQADYAESTGG